MKGVLPPYLLTPLPLGCSGERRASKTRPDLQDPRCPAIMPPMPAAGFDPERHARRLAPAGAALAVVGGCLGGWVGLLVAALGVLLLLLACVSRDDGLLILGPFVRAELVRSTR